MAETETLEKLKLQIDKLPNRERAELAHYLIHSLEQDEDEDVEAAWEVELERRVADIKSGNAAGKPASQVFDELQAKYS